MFLSTIGLTCNLSAIRVRRFLLLKMGHFRQFFVYFDRFTANHFCSKNLDEVFGRMKTAYISAVANFINNLQSEIATLQL